MKTPRRKHYNTQRDESDVCSRERGPLEIGELETPKERRSAPVAAVRYLAGSKFQSNSPEESEYTENSDFTDARSENSEDLVDSYKSERSKYKPKRQSRRYGELRHESQELEQGGHQQPSRSNFAREFKLKYGSNVTSNLQYYTSKATQDTFFHNMDYIHSQFTQFNPNFINFNYGHFSYPNYGMLKNRPGEYYNAQNPPMYTSIHHRPMPDYGYQRPENMLPLNHDYYNRYDPQYMRAQMNYNPLSQGYMRGPESNRSSNMVGDYTPVSQNRYQESSQQYQCSKHDCNSSHYDSSYGHRRTQCEYSHHNEPLEYHHHGHKRDYREKYRGQDYSQDDLNRKDEETMKHAIEKAVKNALDSYITTNKLKAGDETCYTDPLPPSFAVEKSDETLTSHQHDQIYGDIYSKRYKEQFKEYTKEHQYGGNEFMSQKDHHYNRTFDHGYSSNDQPYNTNNPTYFVKDYDYIGNNNNYSPLGNKDLQYHTVDSNYGKDRYEVQESLENDTKEISTYDITKLRNEIQKVMDDVDSLTNNELNDSDVKRFANYEDEKAEGYKKENEEPKMNHMFMSQVTDYNDLGSNKYDYVDMFMTKSTTMYDLQSNKMKESQSLGETFRYGTEEEYGKLESVKKETAEGQGSKGMLNHVDIFNNDGESHDDQYMEEVLTNRDDDEQDDQSPIMRGSTYEVEVNMENTCYYQGTDYQDTSYYASSSFNLNTFNSFSCLMNSSSKMDIKDEEGENMNGSTLSTSDLIESRANFQNQNDDYNTGNTHQGYSAGQGGDEVNRNANVGDDNDNYSSGYDNNNNNNHDVNEGEGDDNDIVSINNNTGTKAPNNNGESIVKYDLLNHLNGQHNDNNNTNNIKNSNLNNNINNCLQNDGKHKGGNYTKSLKVESEKVGDENENPFLKKIVIENGTVKVKGNKLESDNGIFKLRNNERMVNKRGESEEEMMETYTQSEQNKSEHTNGLRGCYTGLFYQSQTQNRKITSEHQINENTKNNTYYSSSKRSHPPNIDGVLHICSRIEQLEESLKRIESHLSSKPEEKNERRKSLEFKVESTKAKPPGTYTQMDQVSELELMEGYKAASMIKKLLHVKSMDSLIPAFTAFVRNRMA